MKRRATRKVLVAATLLAAVGALAPATADPGSNYRLSLTSAGREPNGATPATSAPDTTSPALSLDGLSVAFSSDATNLVAGDTNGAADVFVRRITTGQLMRVSVASSGAQANGPSYSPSLSVDGMIVAFASSATNLVAGDTNGVADIFARDLRTGRTTRESVTSSGRQADGASNTPFVSLFGRWVTFDSAASNFSSHDTNGIADAIIRDREAHTTVRIDPPALQRSPDQPTPQEVPREFSSEIPPTEHGPYAMWTEHPTISYDGHYVSYLRGATRSTTDNPYFQDLFLLDRRTNRSAQVKVPAWGGRAKVLCDEPIISADGNYIAFTAWSVITPNTTGASGNEDPLVRNQPLDYKDILLFTRQSRNIGYTSSSTLGQAGNGDSTHPSISANGQIVAFQSAATNLVADDTNGKVDAFVRDSIARATSRVDIGAPRVESTADAVNPSISYEGRRVAFATTSPVMGSADTNGTMDVYLRDRRTDTRNAPPVLNRVGAKRAVEIGQDIAIKLTGSDPDHEPLRFNILLAPTGSKLNSTTGEFTWKALPDPAAMTGGAIPPVTVVFWVDDVRGAADYEITQFVFRDAAKTVKCHGGVDHC